MDEQRFLGNLTHFGLTRQEAHVYYHLLIEGKQSGYEIAKSTGISRSNAYSALAALVEKGAAYMIEENAKRYIPVHLEEYCENAIRRMQTERDWMLKNLPSEKVEEDGYITIEGEENIRDKITNLLRQVKERVYISCGLICLREFQPELKKLVREEKKVVVLTDGCFEMQGVQVYISEKKGEQIGIITDSRCVLSGEYGKNSMNTCLYSGKKNFVRIFKDALANEIKLIQEIEKRDRRQNDE